MTTKTGSTTVESAASEGTDDLGARSIDLVRHWLHESATTHAHPDPSAERLAGVLGDPVGLDFAVEFVDGVARPQDVVVAGRNLRHVSRLVPAFLPWHLRQALRLGGIFGPVLPRVVIPIARGVLRSMVGHLIVDATPAKLGPALHHLRTAHTRRGRAGSDAPDPRLNINLLGEAVLGEREAARRLAHTRELLERDDVDYVSIKVSSIVSQLTLWAFDEAVEKIVERITPLYEYAAHATAATGERKFINLDMEEYHDLDLTIAVFQRVLDDPRLKDLEAGIVLQAYLPDSLAALQRITDWAMRRRAAGGAPVKVRIVKGANLSMERVDALVHGWPQAPYTSKQSTDANYKRLLDWAFTPEHADAVKVGVAGHNLFDIAHAWLLAEQRGVTGRIDFEMLLGMATAQADAVTATVGRLLLYTPVVRPREFDVAISYLIRRLEENASQENFMSAVFSLADDPAIFDRERDRFLASLAEFRGDPAEDDPPEPRRRQDRLAERPTPDEVDPDAPPRGFANEPDTDPSIPANREWGAGILDRVPASRLGEDTVASSRVEDEDALRALVDTVHTAGVGWGGRSGAERAVVLERAAESLAAHRADLVEVMAAETGKTIDQGDPEVSEAIDFARYYASRARALDEVAGARFVPSALTVVTPPWNFPVAIPTGGMLAALAAGSGVIVKPAPQAKRCAAVIVEALWESGIPRELLAYADIEEGPVGRALLTDDRVDRVILTGAYDTAKLFRSWRPDLPLLAETSGKNAIIVTPSADYDLAAADVVHSAFGHAGQKCSAASLAILVGSAATSDRFLRQLVDAAESLRVDYPQNPAAQMGPTVEPVSGKLETALTTLDDGEEWLVAPQRLDERGRLWSPGIRTGVKPGSHYHLTEFFGPVLGIMRAKTLDEAIRYQNAVELGLTAGLHSLDPGEVARWLEGAEAGNLYVNRGITGAIVRRQPFGGWKRSSVGAGTKAGGPNYLLGLGSWRPEPAPEGTDSTAPEASNGEVATLLEAVTPLLDGEAAALLRTAARSDASWMRDEFDAVRDVSALGVERNLFRYRSLPASVRVGEETPAGDGFRVLAAALATGSDFDVSTSTPLPVRLRTVLRARGVPIAVESDADWLARVARDGVALPGPGGARRESGRVRLAGGDARALAEAVGGSPDVAIYAGEVTTAGRIELLPFLHEQAVSITNHRFGDPTRLSEGVI